MTNTAIGIDTDTDTATDKKEIIYNKKHVTLSESRRFFVKEPIQEPAQAPVPIIIPIPTPITIPGDESEPAPVPRTNVD